MSWLKSKILLGVLWLILSISLGLWWMLLGLNQSKQIFELQKKIGKQEEAEFIFYKQNRMIKMEGSFFILLLAIGGCTLLLLTHREYERSNSLKNFFATLTHEMKTPLASLRLQAETLEEEIKSKQVKTILKRLIDDTTRLELQMDKSLYLASINRKESLFFEKINFDEFIKQFSTTYPIIKIKSKEKIYIKTDKRALESVFKNLTENSIHHGDAKNIFIEYKINSDFCQILFSDNGKGFEGDIQKLGKLYYKHKTSSGSGIGIYLIENLISKMNGEVKFSNLDKKFIVELKIPIWKES